MSTNEPKDAEVVADSTSTSTVEPSEPVASVADGDPEEEIAGDELVEESIEIVSSEIEPVSGQVVAVATEALRPPPPPRPLEEPVERLASAELEALPAASSEDADVVEPKPQVASPKLPGVAPRPPQPPAQPPPAAAARIATLDDTIASARASAAARALGAGALITLYETELAALGPQSRGRQASYAHEIGELSARHGDEGGAVKAWARALQADPSLRPNLWAIRRAFERRQMWPNVLRLLEAELRFAATPAERAELLVERGVVLEDRVGDLPAAIAAFEAAAKEDPTALRAQMALERRVLEDGGDLAKVRSVVTALAAATPDLARRAALLIDLARQEAADGELGIERARALLDEALALELGDGSTTAFAGGASSAALDELERLARRAQRPAWSEEALETRVEMLALDEIPRPPTSAAETGRLSRGAILRLRQAALAEERGDLPAALAYLETARALAVEDPTTAGVVACELYAVSLALGNTEMVGRLALASAPLVQGAYLEAIEAFEKAGLVDLAREATTLAERAGLGDALAARARRRAELDGDDEALLRGYVAEGSFSRAASIAGDRLGRADEAIEHLDRAVVAEPTIALHADRLEWRLLRAGRFADVAALLGRRIAAETSPPQRLELVAQRAGLLAERVGDLEGALVGLRELVEARPDDLRLRLQLAFVAQRAGQTAEAAEQLARASALTTSQERRLDLEIARGSLLGWQLGDVAGAEAAFREALRLHPTDGRATAALEDLYERQRADSRTSATPDDAPQRVDGLVAALRAEIDANANPDRATALLSRLAELHERERQDPRAASAIYQELYDRSLDPDEQAVALRGLHRAFTALGEPARVIDALERESSLLADERSQAGQRARIAWEKERMGDPSAAEDDYRRLVESESTPEILASARLGRLRAAYRTGDDAEIAASLGALVGLVDDELVGLRGALDTEHAAALAAQGEPEEAAVVAARARSLIPDSVLAQLATLTTAGRRQDVVGVANALRFLGDGASTPTVRASLLRRAGLLALAAEQDGVTALTAAEDLEPDDVSALAVGEAVETPARLAARVALAEDGRRGPWLLALGEAQAKEGQLAAATSTFGELLTRDPSSLLALELDRRVRRAAGDRRGYARRTLALGEVVVEIERAAVLLAEAGRAFEELGERDAAVYAYREALERTPLDGAIFAKARGLLVHDAASEGDEHAEARAHAKAALLELYDHRLAHAEDVAERIDLLLERSDLCAGEGDRAAAERDARAILELEPDEPRAVAALFRLCADDPRRLEESRELAARVEALSIDPSTRRDLLLLNADIEQRDGGDPERAIVAFEAALAIDEDAGTLRALAVLLRERRHWQRAVDVRARLIPLVRADEGALVEIAIAQIYLDGFADPAAARLAAFRALRLDPLSHDATVLLLTHRVTSPPSAEALEILAVAADAARSLLVEDGRRSAGLRQLRAVASVQGDEELLALTEQLSALEQLSVPETRPVYALPERAIAPVAGALLRAPLLDSVARELVLAVAETLTKLHPVDATRFGKTARVSAKQREAELRAFDMLAKIVGAEEISYELGTSSFIESDHERIVIGRDAIPLVARASGRFRAARALALFADRTGVLDRIDDTALVAFFAGCLAVAKVAWPAHLAALKPSAALVDERARAIDKALSRRERKALLALAPKLADLPDPRRYRAAVLSAAARSALFIGGDLSAVAAELGDDVARELGRVAVSAPFVAARKPWLSGGRA